MSIEVLPRIMDLEYKNKITFKVFNAKVHNMLTDAAITTTFFYLYLTLNCAHLVFY